MPFIQARVKLTNGNGNVVTRDSSVLNVNGNVGALPNDLRSDKLLVIGGALNLTKFYFVTGDKLLVEKTVYTGSNNTPVSTKSAVISVNRTGWLLLSDLAPAGFKESEISSSNSFQVRYFIEPVEYTGDRYYSTAGSLERISSVNFCNRLIYAASELAPAGIKDPYASMYFWGETNPDTGETALVIPATLDDISGLFDNAATIGAYGNVAPLPKIITLGKIKKMVRTFYNAFAYGMFTYSTPLDAVVFGEMDVSEVTDFSYCFGQCFQANPDIENWDVSSATNMTGMFSIVVDWTTDRWTRNLSKWCVSKITSEPANFSTNHPMSAAQKPVWGTCPSANPVVVGHGLYWDIGGTNRIGDIPNGVDRINWANTKKIYIIFDVSNLPANSKITMSSWTSAQNVTGDYEGGVTATDNGPLEISTIDLLTVNIPEAIKTPKTIKLSVIPRLPRSTFYGTSSSIDIAINGHIIYKAIIFRVYGER